MLPFHPPLPVAWNLPFQAAAVAGSQYSTLMSESGDGFSVASTRQNAGRSENGLPPPRPPRAGGVNPPAATEVAEVMVVSGSLREDSASHDCAKAGFAIVRARIAAIVKE